MSLYIYPYSQASESAKLLARAMQARVMRRIGTRVRPSETDTIVNWGCSVLHFNPRNSTVLNHPDQVAIATNKLQTFETLRQNNIPVPEVTTSRIVAQEWCRAGKVVMGRNLANGMGGAGITVYPSGTDPTLIQQHLFYTKYFPHKVEIRVHIVKNHVRSPENEDPEPTYIQRKSKRMEWAANYGHLPSAQYIHNHTNGYVYVRGDVNPYGINYNAAILGCQQALQALNLDFAAFDVLVTSLGKYVILEANTAPGIEGSTVQFYNNHINVYPA